MAASRLTDAQVTAIRNVFDNFDRNGDGSLNLAEIGHVMKKLGRHLSDDELKRKFALMDKNGSGRVEFQEFVNVAAEILVSPWTDPEIERAFKMFDKDNSGKISAEELKQLATASGIRATKAELELMLKSADSDEDGQVNYNEFYRIMKS